MPQRFSSRGRLSLLLLLAGGLLSGCAAMPGAPAPADETAQTTAAPGTITAHVNGRQSVFMGVSSN